MVLPFPRCCLQQLGRIGIADWGSHLPLCTFSFCTVKSSPSPLPHVPFYGFITLLRAHDSLLFKVPCPCHGEAYDRKDGVGVDLFLENSAPSHESGCSGLSMWCLCYLKGSVSLLSECSAVIYGFSMIEKHAPSSKDLSHRTDFSVWNLGMYMKILMLNYISVKI